MENIFLNYMSGNIVGVISVVISSGLSAWFLCFFKRSIFRWLGLVLLPILYSYYAYWIPIWNSGSSDPQNAGYAYVFIPFMTVIGVVFSASAILFYKIILERYDRKQKGSTPKSVRPR